MAIGGARISEEDGVDSCGHHTEFIIDGRGCVGNL